MDKKIFIDRRKRLVEKVKELNSDKKASIFLWSDFEQGAFSFRQESTFYYFTGINEPAVALRIDDNKTTLFVPNTNGSRKKWVPGSFELSKEDVQRSGVDEIVYLGEPVTGFSLSPLFSEQEYNKLIQQVKNDIVESGSLFTCYPARGFNYCQQVALVDRLQKFIPKLSDSIIDITSVVSDMRRCKDKGEIEQIFKAIRFTTEAIVSISELINSENNEYDIQAGLEYIMTIAGVQRAFPLIVAGGKNGTILHYAENSASLSKGELVIVDCGAEYNHYCADLTRTFPVSGKFNKRQRELYAIVLECQDYVSSLLKPGIWLNNKEKPKESLHHLALDFFAKKGCDKYFIHGIGHYLGLDAHDVGSYSEPLKDGDVISLEPGLYLSDENIGIRIEDNYWILNDGYHCLSEDLPKAVDDVEALLKK